MTDQSQELSLANLEARLARVAELDAVALEAEHTAVLGRKSGVLTVAVRQIPTLPPDQRRRFGAEINALKVRFEEAFAQRRAALAEAGRRLGPGLDLSMPGRRRWVGGLHPVTRVVDRVLEIFRGLGFAVATGPEIETEWNNFLALNFPPDHPAMDMHDTMYLQTSVACGPLSVVGYQLSEEEGNRPPATDSRQPRTGQRRPPTDDRRLLLRTHTSPVQIRVMQAEPPPYRVVIPGMCYRKDDFDPSHAPVFSQIEGLAVDEGIGFVDLKATLTHFAHEFFGPERGVRFRPSFFPFTEPSAEMDLQCGVCGGSGCPVCKQTGWVEILGCGMVHPRVLENCGVDSERWTGWAFGMGPGRIALARYGIPDLRLLYEGDMRVLGQFAGFE